MTITKEKKHQLLAKYTADLSNAKNTVIVQQKAIPVNVANQIRIDLKETQGTMNIIKKRIFLRALKDAGLEQVDVSTLEGPVFALYAQENEFGPLKIINKYLKEFKKDNKGSEFSFIGGWFEKQWQSGDYVNELANVPTKEELIAKLCYLFNYPLQSFACAVSEIAKKNGGEVVEEANEQSEEVPQGGIKEEPKEEVVEESKEEAKEETVEEPKEETPAEETPVEATE